MTAIGSLASARSGTQQEQRGFSWICLPLPPAHPRESCCGLVADLRRQGRWWLQAGLLFKGTENSAKPALEGAAFWSAFASPLHDFAPTCSSLFLLILFFFSCSFFFHLAYCL